MICVTGDMHGDLSRFNDKKIKRLKKGDILIVCGDFGFVWDGSEAEQKRLKAIGRKKFYTLFVEGCHDNYELLGKYPEEDFFGGKVSVVSGNLMRMKRGSVFDLDGGSFFAFGGGQTKEIDVRGETNRWWEEELPTDEEIELARAALEKRGNSVDCIITHEPPASMKKFLDCGAGQNCSMHSFFDYIKDNCSFKSWYFGMAHKNKAIPPKFRCLFDEVVQLEPFSDGKNK